MTFLGIRKCHLFYSFFLRKTIYMRIIIKPEGHFVSMESTRGVNWMFLMANEINLCQYMHPASLQGSSALLDQLVVSLVRPTLFWTIFMIAATFYFFDSFFPLRMPILWLMLSMLTPPVRFQTNLSAFFSRNILFLLMASATI